MAVDPPRCQHIALHANDLEVVRSFHRDILGLEVANYLPDEGVLAFQLRDGFVLRYERSDHPVDTESVRFIGLELSSFEDVDQSIPLDGGSRSSSTTRTPDPERRRADSEHVLNCALSAQNR